MNRLHPFTFPFARRLTLTVAVGLLLAPAATQAQSDTFWNAGTGDFTTNSNWTNAAPGIGKWFVDNGGTAQLSTLQVVNDGVLGSTPGTSGQLQILDGGILSSAGFAELGLVVAKEGTATLTMEAGGYADLKNLFLGGDTGSNGTASINGGNLTVDNFLHLGHAGRGTLTLTNNGQIQTLKADIGRYLGGNGTATLTNGLWQNTDAVFVGAEGNGTLTLAPQGTLLSKSLYLGQDATGRGTTTVAGGNLTLSDTLAVGVFGNGTLQGTTGRISTRFLQVGLQDGSHGTATFNGTVSVTGTDDISLGVDPGSTGTLSLTENASLTTPSLVVGNFASGTFTAGRHTTFTVDNVGIAVETGSTGTLTLDGGTLTTAAIVAGLGTARLNLHDGSTLRPLNANGITLEGFGPGGITLTGNVTFDTGTRTIAAISSLGGTGQLIKTGAGTLTLSGTNTYNGGTQIRAGTVTLTNNASLGTGEVALGTAELRAAADVTVSGNVNAGIILLSVTANQTGTISADAGKTLTLAPMDFLLVAGSTLRVGSSGHTGTVVFAPTGAVALPGSAALAVDHGTLRAGNHALAFTTGIADSTTVATGATLDFDDYFRPTDAIYNLQGNGTVHIGSNASTLLTVERGDFSGSITGAGGLVKDSPATLTLSGNNAYFSDTTVEQGTLLVTGSLGLGLGTVTVNPDGTLGGTGTVGAISLDGGTLAPGTAGVGTLTSGTLFWTAGTLRFDLGPTPATADLLAINGALTGLGTTYAFEFVDQGWTPGTTYTLLSFDSTAIPLDHFTVTNAGGFAGTFAYQGNTLQYTVTSVPEPGTWAALLLCATAVILHRHRRRTSRSS